MIVVDASVLTNALTDDDRLGVSARAELARDYAWAEPEHVVVEVFSAVRGRYLGGRISSERAEGAVTALGELAFDLIRTTTLLGRMWELRATVTAYDAAYVALAEAFDCPLVTTDARLARSTGVRCEVRLAVPPG